MNPSKCRYEVSIKVTGVKKPYKFTYPSLFEFRRDLSDYIAAMVEDEDERTITISKIRNS